MVTYLVSSITSDPESVVINTEERGDSVRFRIHVAPDDMGRVIGRRGRVAQAIRTVVAAAGNDGNYTAIDFPAARPGVIAVGATSLNDHHNYNNPVGAQEYVALYSNFSPRLDVVAPGGDPDTRQQTCIPDPNPAVGCPDYLQWILGLFSANAQGAQGPQPDLADHWLAGGASRARRRRAAGLVGSISS